MAGRLGQGCSTVLLTPRGGGSPIADLGTPALTWGRRLNTITDARATVGPDDPALPTVDAWTHELQVWHDGVLAWCGPSWEPTFEETSVTLPARDLAQWFTRRWLPLDRDLDADLGTIYAAYVRDALALDPSPGIVLHPSTIGTRGKRKVLAADHKRAGDALNELSRSGVDWTMIARDLLTGDTSDAGLAEDLPPLSAFMVNAPKVTLKGAEAASEWATLGGKDPRTGAQIVGHAHIVGPTTGLLQNTSSEPTILDVESANRNARTQLDSRAHVPRELTATLTPDAPAMSQLVAGARWPVNLMVGCYEVVETMLLTDVRVTQGVTDTGVSVSVGVTLVSLSPDEAES